MRNFPDDFCDNLSHDVDVAHAEIFDNLKRHYMQSDIPDDFWELLAQDVDIAHREAMVELFTKETLMEMMGKIHDAVMQESLRQAIKTVAEERGVDEKTVIKNYFGGTTDADNKSGKQH